MTHEWTRAEYTISTDPRRLDLDLIHDFLSTRSYWAAGRSRERVVCSIEHSLPFGLYHPSGQVGFARVVTDHVVLPFPASSWRRSTPTPTAPDLARPWPMA